MSFLSHLRQHRQANLSNFTRVYVDQEQIGWTKKDFAASLASCSSGTWQLKPDGVCLNPDLKNFERRSAAVHSCFLELSAKNVLPPLPDYSAFGGDDWLPAGKNTLFQVHRFYSIYLGIEIHAIMVNGYENDHYWMAVRSDHVDDGPGLLDIIVAGTVRIGETIDEAALEEGQGECGITVQDMQFVEPVSTLYVTYPLRGGFLRNEVYHVYDFNTLDRFKPRVVDPIEVARFEFMTIKDVMHLVSETNAIKPQMNIVLLDFFVRHGHLTKDHPDYQTIVDNLYQPMVLA